MRLIRPQINPEYEQLVPPMTREAFDSLVSSIKANGQYYPIVVNGKGEVLDGHHRLKACIKLDIEPKTKEKVFFNKLQEKLYVIESNLQRRQLTVAQRIQLALRKKPILQELARLNMSASGKGVQICTPLKRVNEVIAKDSRGVSAMQIYKMETILETADAQLAERVLSGRTRIDKAYRQLQNKAKRDKILDSSKELLKHFPDLNSENCKILEGDFRKLEKQISDSSVALIFTDPFYDEEHIPDYHSLAVVANRVLINGGSLVANASQDNFLKIGSMMEDAAPLLNYWSFFCIKHKGSFARIWTRNINVKFRPAIWFVKGEKLQLPDYVDDLIESKTPDKSLDKNAQSPVEAKYIITKLTVPGQIVMDPFLGQGTTALASLETDRKFIGMEIDPDKIKLINAQISNWQSQQSKLSSNHKFSNMVKANLSGNGVLPDIAS